MEVLLGGILCIALSVVTSVLGLAAIDPQGVRRRGRENEVAPPRLAMQTGPAYIPLDLGPVAAAWPSQRPWPKSTLPRLPWPSENWADNYFGRKGNVFSSPKTATAQEETDEWFQSKDEQPPVAAFAGAAEPVRPVQPTPQPQARPQPQPKPAAKPAAKPDKAAPAAKATDAPSAKEVVAMVEKLGLAGAVDEVRKRTGWDFQKAAQFLAQTLREAREGRR